jgi:Flp pilus assembly pilin Flp
LPGFDIANYNNRSGILPWRELKIMKTLRRLVSKEVAATSVEYAIMLGFIAVVCIGAVLLAGEQTWTFFDHSHSEIDKAITTP